jgi:hypothetical protein
MDQNIEHIRNNLLLVEQRVREAQERSGRHGEVGIVAATKYVGVEEMRLVREAGITLVGENRAEELMQKAERYGDGLEFHFIGHVQHRKVRDILPYVSMIHSVDSLRLVKSLHERSERSIEVLLQVNVSGEESKYGILPSEAEAFLEQSLPYDRVRFVGLMTMAPLVEDAETVRPVFRGLRELCDRLASVFDTRYELRHLSMGMTNDFDVAVEEGATLVRVGSVLFSAS